LPLSRKYPGESSMLDGAEPPKQESRARLGATFGS
jgi:hypothetical protein